MAELFFIHTTVRYFQENDMDVRTLGNGIYVGIKVEVYFLHHLKDRKMK